MNLIKALEDSLELLGIEGNIRPNVPNDFKEFNNVVGAPKNPSDGSSSEIFSYQEEYEQAWNKHHKVILNKSRKIGATETALRIIAFNCISGKYQSHHRVMIVAGNKQEVANRFIERFVAIFGDGFHDLDDKWWGIDDIIIERKSSKIRLFNNIVIQAYPANESVRGEDNVICVFMSESAFINLVDDSKVYNAVHPNISNIMNADFILESTPNGKRGFFWDLWTDQSNEYFKLEQPYTVALGKLLDRNTIEAEKQNTRIDFEQEYNCKFSTSLNAAFTDVNYVEETVDDYSDL